MVENVGKKMAIDVACAFAGLIAFSTLWYTLHPYHRGFFCNDESINYPQVKTIVTKKILYSVGLAIPLIVIVSGEYALAKKSKNHLDIQIFRWNIPSWVGQIYEKLGYLFFSCLVTVSIVVAIKYSVGQLRPHFLAVCQPKVDCNMPNDFTKYITDYQCVETLSAEQFDDIRVSFPSGHAAFHACVMIYVTLYLQLRMTSSYLKIVRLLLQTVLMLLAALTAISRVLDFHHFWSDVLAGWLFGAAIAILIVFRVANFFHPKEADEDLSLETPTFSTTL